MPMLRAFLGVSSRVEILLFLGGSKGSAHATEVANATGYSPRTLQIQLQEMQLSGQVLGPPKSLDENAPVRRGTNRLYHLNDEIREFLSPRTVFPEWMPWASLFRISESVLELFPKVGNQNLNPLVVSSSLREVLSREFKTLLAHGIWCEFGFQMNTKGDALLERFCQRFPEILEDLGSTPAS
jgi:hypothetical protein